jgi:hypothetical protein
MRSFILYFSPDIMKSRMMRWAGHVACIGKNGNAYRILARKSRGEETGGKTYM